jgi:hypothetical protein
MLMRNPNTLIDVSGFLVSGLSGGIFPANVPPGFLLPISVAILLTYGYDAVRGYLLHTGALLPIRVEVRILLCSMAVFVPLGYVFSGSPSSAAANWARWVCTSVHDAVPDLLPPTSLIRGRDGS